MVAVPAARPLTRPLTLTPAVAPALLLQVPEGVTHESVVVPPTQRLPVPVMGSGEAITVIVLVTVQPVPNEYVIVVLPGATPSTTPLREPTVATPELLLQTPPGTPSVRVVVRPTHTLEAPVIATGEVLTVTCVLLWQPVGAV